MTVTKTFSIKLSNDQYYGWVGREETYKGLESDLGVTAHKPGSSLPKGISFGQQIKPPRIRIRTTGGKTRVRFIAPDKMEEQVYKKGLVGKKIKIKGDDGKYKDENICWVSTKSN